MPEDTSIPHTPQKALRAAQVTLVGLVLAVIFMVHQRVSGIGMMGFDSYPVILSARVGGWSDFVGTFAEELMDGRYSGHYYRPALNLSFALDYGMWGLEAWGYQLTATLLFAACGCAVAALMTRLLGGRLGAGAIAAALFFFLHDSHFEVIPVPARRPEMLCALFACLSLASQLGEKTLHKRWPLMPAVWMLLAAASKETGYALPVIGVLAVFLYSPASSWRERGQAALRAGVVHGVLIAGLLAARIAVLGGMGGPAPLPEGFVGPSSMELTGVLLRRLMVPQNVASWGLVVPILGGLGLFSVLATCALSASGRKAILLPCAWMAVVGMLYGISRSIEQWYLYLPVVGLSLFVGVGVDQMAGAMRWKRIGPRAFAVFGSMCLAGLCLCQVRYSPLIHPYSEWGEASLASAQFFEKLESRIARTPPGQLIKAPPIPVWYPVVNTGPAIRGAAILEDYSVQAWLELTHPERKFRVLKRPPVTPLERDESAVQLQRAFEFGLSRKP
jgi:hypothetical protein